MSSARSQRIVNSRTRIPSPKPDASLNTINQDEVGFMFQDLKQDNPRVWQAITSLQSNPPPQAFYAEIILAGSQLEEQDVLRHPCILRLPIDPYRMWKVQSVILQDIEIACKQMPQDKDFIVDILISRNKRVTFNSIFLSSANLPTIKVGGTYYNKISGASIGTNELFEDDEFRVDIIQADNFVLDCWIVIRGTANLLKDKPSSNG